MGYEILRGHGAALGKKSEFVDILEALGASGQGRVENVQSVVGCRQSCYLPRRVEGRDIHEHIVTLRQRPTLLLPDFLPIAAEHDTFAGHHTLNTDRCPVIIRGL